MVNYLPLNPLKGTLVSGNHPQKSSNTNINSFDEAFTNDRTHRKSFRPPPSWKAGVCSSRGRGVFRQSPILFCNKVIVILFNFDKKARQ